MGRVCNGQDKTSCEVCGKSQDSCFEVNLGGERHVFDSFECAMRGLIRKCTLCDNIVFDLGVVIGHRLYCSTPCAVQATDCEPDPHVRLGKRAGL